MDDGPDASVRGRAVTGVLWAVLQKGAARVTTLVTFVVLGRILEPAQFGIVAVAVALVGLVNVFSDVGFGTYVIQHRALTQRQISTVFWTALALGAALAGALAAADRPLADLLGQPEAGPVLQALAALVLLTSLTSLPTALLKRDLEFKVIAVRGVVASVGAAAVAIAVALGGGGVWSLVAQHLVHAVLSIAVLWTAARWRPSWSYDLATARTATSYGSSVLAIQFVAQLRQRSDVLVLGAIAGPVVLGYYVIATRIMATLLDTAVSVISTVASPVFARLKDDVPRLRRAYRSAVYDSLAIVSPLLLLLAITAPVLIPAVFGDQWRPSTTVAQVLVVSGLVSTIIYFDRGLMIALDRRRTELLLSTATTVIGTLLVAAAATQSLLFVAVAVSARAALAWPLRLRLSSSLLDLSLREHLLQISRVLGAVAVAGTPAWLVMAMLDDRHPIPAVFGSVAMVALLYPATLRRLSPAIWSDLRGALTRRRMGSAPESSDASIAVREGLR